MGCAAILPPWQAGAGFVSPRNGLDCLTMPRIARPLLPLLVFSALAQPQAWSGIDVPSAQDEVD